VIYLQGAPAGVIEINGTVIVELITFLIMLYVLARYVYPVIVRLAEARQRAIAAQLQEAEKDRAEAEATLQQAAGKLADARTTAQQVIDAALKTGEQLRQDLRAKAEEDAKRIAESARKEIEVERDKAVQAVRDEVAGLVISATEKVIGETLDEQKHKKLIDKAIEEAAGGLGRG
jgi:F-type H+-transporting ATPase subunit b